MCHEREERGGGQGAWAGPVRMRAWRREGGRADGRARTVMDEGGEQERKRRGQRRANQSPVRSGNYGGQDTPASAPSSLSLSPASPSCDVGPALLAVNSIPGLCPLSARPSLCPLLDPPDARSTGRGRAATAPRQTVPGLLSASQRARMRFNMACAQSHQPIIDLIAHRGLEARGSRPRWPSAAKACPPHLNMHRSVHGARRTVHAAAAANRTQLSFIARHKRIQQRIRIGRILPGSPALRNILPHPRGRPRYRPRPKPPRRLSRVPVASPRRPMHIGESHVPPDSYSERTPRVRIPDGPSSFFSAQISEARVLCYVQLAMHEQHTQACSPSTRRRRPCARSRLIDGRRSDSESDWETWSSTDRARCASQPRQSPADRPAAGPAFSA